MKKLNKRQRKEIYLRLAEQFEKAITEKGFAIMFLYNQRFGGSPYLCSCFQNILREFDVYNVKLSDWFPEFALFEPTEEEKLELEGAEICGGCSAWWDVSKPDVNEKKALALYFCAAMCE